MLRSAPKDANAVGGTYRAIPLHRSDENSPLRICLIVEADCDPATGPLVLLRDLPDASVYLGCMVDALGAGREWLEIWVQNVDNFRSSFPVHQQQMVNPLLDENWMARAAAFRSLAPGDGITTGWESTHAPALFYDPVVSGPVYPTDEASGTPWELCLDDTLLESKGLPTYGQSLARYLHVPAKGADSPFVPLTRDSPTNENTRTREQAFPNLVPLNLGGGLMMVRHFSPLSYDDFVELLSGRAWKGVERGQSAFRPTGIYRTLQDANVINQGGGHLFHGHHGRAGRMAESFHLKLQLILSALRLVRRCVRHQQLPFLNLAAASFRIRLSECDSSLPFFWTFRTALVVPSEAIPLSIESTEARYFTATRSRAASIYRPEDLSLPVAGTAGVSIRKVLDADGEELSLEGTLVAQERLDLGRSDLLWIRLPLPSGRVDLYATADPKEPSRPGELRFRTLPQRLAPDVAAALREIEGIPQTNVSFETIPLLSTPCDLYALGVLAVRTLLVDDELTLPVALDEMLSLARQVAATAADDPDRSVADRVRAIMEKDPARAALLGPRHLLRQQAAEAGATRLFPADLWWEAIALILRFFPGIGPDSYCRDYGDAPPLALETIFQEPMQALEILIRRSRALLLIDWTANREISSVIRSLQARHGNAAPKPR